MRISIDIRLPKFPILIDPFTEYFLKNHVKKSVRWECPNCKEFVLKQYDKTCSSCGVEGLYWGSENEEKTND